MSSNKMGRGRKSLMSRLVSDIDLMPDNELESWINNILSGTNMTEIKTLNQILTKELRTHSIEKLAKRNFKICDRCYSTYPMNTHICSYCRNNKLSTNLRVSMMMSDI